MSAKEPGTLIRRRHFAQVPDALATDKRLSSHAVRVWLRLDKYAGKDGRAFPTREQLADDLGLSLATVKRALMELAQFGWIARTRRGEFSNVWDTELMDAPAVPDTKPNAVPAAHIRAARRLTGEPSGGSPTSRLSKETQLKETQLKETPPPPPSAPTSRARANRTPGETTNGHRPDQFAEFWNLYPKPEGEPAARRAWAKATKTTPPADVIAGARRYAEYIARERKADRFIAHPVNWLNGERWNDHTNTPAPADVDRSIWGDALDNLTDTNTTRTDPIWGDALEEAK